MLKFAEKEAKNRGFLHIGLGVGLTKDYGPAQKLYIKNGYTPNGLGVTSYYQTIEHGKSCLMDDNLIIWLSKKLYDKA